MDKIPEKYRPMVGSIMDTARQIFDSKKQVSAMVLLCKLDGSMFAFPIDCSSGQAKDESAAKAAFIAQVARPDFVVMVSESWMMESPNMDYKALIEKYGSISQCPNRKEAVSLSLETPEGNWLGLAYIVEENGERKLEPLKFMDSSHMEGRFSNFLSKPPTTTVH